jgi:hypothetical protein
VSTDLHARLTAAVAAQKWVAEEATEGPWTVEPHHRLVQGCRCLSCVEDQPSGYEIPELYSPPGHGVFPVFENEADANHAAAWNPAVALRWLAMAERDLARHKPRVAFSNPVCHFCMTFFPCEDIVDLADALGVPIEEE